MNKIKTAIFLLLSGQLLLITGCGEKLNKSESTEKESVTITLPEIEDKAGKEKESVIISLPEIVNKTEKEVEIILGKPEKIKKHTAYPCKKANCKIAFYKTGKIEVIFKEGKANRITIYDTPNLINNKNALKFLGLKDNRRATFRNPTSVARWDNVNNIAEISFTHTFIYIIVDR